jgi:hypothetical protein
MQQRKVDYMTDYIVYQSHLKPSKIRGNLPDVFCTYIANDSHIGWHYTITSEREDAYIFDESQKKDAEFIADCWGMKVEKLI